MPARIALVTVLLMLTAIGTGCPDAYGIGGKMDQAIEEDHSGPRRRLCPDGQPAKYICKGSNYSDCYWGCP